MRGDGRGAGAARGAPHMPGESAGATAGAGKSSRIPRGAQLMRTAAASRPGFSRFSVERIGKSSNCRHRLRSVICFCTRLKKHKEIALGVVDEDQLVVPVGFHARVLQLVCGFARIGHGKEELRLGAGVRGVKLNVHIGSAGRGEAHIAIGLFRLEAQIGIELLLRGAVADRQVKAHQFIGDAALAEVHSLVEGVARAGHVLGELGDAALRVVHRRDHVARRGLAHRRGLEADGIVDTFRARSDRRPRSRRA